MITLPLFSPHASLWSLRLFSAFSPMAFRFSRVFLRCFRLRFSRRGRRCLAQSLPFTDLTTLAAFFACIAFFAFSRAVLPTLRGARSLEIRLKSILRSSILTASTRTSTRSPGDKSGRWIHPSGVALPVKAIVVIVQRRDMDQTINEQVVQTDEEAKASDAGNYAFKDVTYGRA